jgi:tRNA modification GTPase
LVLWVTDPDGPVRLPELGPGQTAWAVRNKVDLLDSDAQRRVAEIELGAPVFAVSALAGTGMAALTAALVRFATESFASGPEVLVTRERHRATLQQAVAALERAVSDRAGGREDIIAEELRLAGRALGQLTGRVDVEDILDVIFRDFCIGK